MPAELDSPSMPAVDLAGPAGPLGAAGTNIAGEPSQPNKPAKKKSKSDTDDDSAEARSRQAMVKKWQAKITKAREKWSGDFQRMRDNMDFVYGLQWKGQKSLNEDRYVVNMTLRTVNQGVAMVYARDPRVEARRRKRLDFKIWDGHMETIMQAAMLAQQSQAMGMPVPGEVMALINDFQAGKLHQTLVEKVGKTLEVIYQYQMDTQQPRFKLQMKQLVRRIRTCGVGYIKVLFCRDYDSELTHSETRMSSTDRLQQAKALMEKLDAGKLDESSSDMEQLKSLIASLGTAPLDSEATSIKEHLIFDFPQATSIIPDPACRCLKGFVGAHWVVEEMFYPLDFVNAFFEKDIKPGGELKLYGRDNKPYEGATTETDASGEGGVKKVCLWNVYDLDTKSTFTLCQGYKDYVMEPEAVTPATKGFWNIFPITFNDIEIEEGCTGSIFPPSDVDLLRPTQKEWNRCRQSLRKHRKANAPRYVYPDGALSEEDLDRLENGEEQEFIKLKGLQPGVEPGKVLQALKVEPINPLVYETESLREDTLLATGQQEANIGPAQPNVTATVGTIAEQSRMSVAASDIDGLDDCLTEVAQCGGEMLLRELSVDTVKRIAGPGAVWPEQNREDFINELELEVVAASSGRPNKAVEISNWERLAPILMNMGANPQAVIRETVRRADDRMEPSDFFPLPLPAMPNPSPVGAAPPAAGAPSGPGPRQMGPPRPVGPSRQPLRSGGA